MPDSIDCTDQILEVKKRNSRTLSGMIFGGLGSKNDHSISSNYFNISGRTQ